MPAREASTSHHRWYSSSSLTRPFPIETLSMSGKAGRYFSARLLPSDEAGGAEAFAVGLPAAAHLKHPKWVANSPSAHVSFLSILHQNLKGLLLILHHHFLTLHHLDHHLLS